jgi:hypothetical protein
VFRVEVRILSKIFLIIKGVFKYAHLRVYLDMGFGERGGLWSRSRILGARSEWGLLYGRGVLQLLGWTVWEGVCSQEDGGGYAG